MEQELFKLAAGNSIWAALFVLLFLYTIYDSRQRAKSSSIHCINLKGYA